MLQNQGRQEVVFRGLRICQGKQKVVGLLVVHQMQGDHVQEVPTGRHNNQEKL